MLQQEHCTKAKATGRTLVFTASNQEECNHATHASAAKTMKFKERYKTRNGIEGTISQAIRACDLRQSRYLGLAKTHLHNVLSSLAVNVHRFWLTGLTINHSLRHARLGLLSLWLDTVGIRQQYLLSGETFLRLSATLPSLRVTALGSASRTIWLGPKPKG